jgi:hypothetical protein
MASATVRLIGGPTLVIEAGGLRLLTDPTFDQPGPFDVVLLSHDQHGDDPGLLERVPLVLTTSDAAQRLGGSARALPPWYHLSLPRFDGVALRITGVPAQEGRTGPRTPDSFCPVWTRQPSMSAAATPPWTSSSRWRNAVRRSASPCCSWTAT